MPLFLDVHTLGEGVAAKDVAEAHKRDLEVQGQHGVNYCRYWVSEGRKGLLPRRGAQRGGGEHRPP